MSEILTVAATAATAGWESLTDDQCADAECAMTWRCHDVHHYEILP